MQMSAAAQATPTGVSTPMAATSTAPASSGGFDTIGAITTVHFALIAVLALLTLAAIVYGMTQRRRRRRAERDEQARMESLGCEAPLAGIAPLAPGPGLKEHPSIPLHSDPVRVSGREMPILAEPVADRVPPLAPDQPAAPAQASLTRIKGLGPKVQARLAELGVTRVDQLAALTDDEADALDAQLGAFRGRIARDRWVEQARFLAAGDVRGFEAVFGRL